MKFYTIPKWTKYIAQDSNGNWWAYDAKPKYDLKLDWSAIGQRQQIYPVVASTLSQYKGIYQYLDA